MKKKPLQFLGLFLLILLSTSVAIVIGSDSHPYVILISFDGFRWDYANRGLTPNIDRIKSEGVAALSLQPVFPTSTFPNHYSIITGMYPENHGIITNSFLDPYSHRKYTFQDSLSLRDGRWYLGEAFWETAERQGIKTASFFWPGSEMELEYRHPAYYRTYDHSIPYEDRIQGVLDWLEMPEKQRPHFITVYFHETDTEAHSHGTETPETNKAIQTLDSRLGSLLDGLEKIGMLAKMNVVLISDHGMTDVSSERTVAINRILDLEKCHIQNYGAYLLVEPNPPFFEEVYGLLSTKKDHFSVFKKEDMPEHLHFSRHPFISSLVVLADLGWTFVDERGDYLRRSRGMHGYDNHLLDMHGIFFAMGPEFKKGYRTGSLWCIDIYPLLCEIFNVQSRSNIDGRLERIGFILKPKPHS